MSRAALSCVVLAATLGTFASVAQKAAATAGDDSHVAKLFRPPAPLPSYDVATIKKADPDASNRTVQINGAPMKIYSGGTTIKGYIRGAYGAPADQLIVGGPAWISNDSYVIQGKPPADLQIAMKKMTRTERNDQDRMMQQSLLAERFHLKAHFEMRQMPILELTPAKGGLKIKLPPPVDPGAAPLSQSAILDAAKAGKLPPNMSFMHTKPGGIMVLAGTTGMNQIVSLVQRRPEAGGRPVVDKTGMPEQFYIDDLEWNTGGDSAATVGGDDAPPLFAALNEKLGIKVSETKGTVEVLVIDSIDRPTDN